MVSPAPAVPRAGTPFWWPSPARDGGYVRRATPGAWPRPPRTGSIMSSRRCRCANGRNVINLVGTQALTLLVGARAQGRQRCFAYPPAGHRGPSSPDQPRGRRTGAARSGQFRASFLKLFVDGAPVARFSKPGQAIFEVKDLAVGQHSVRLERINEDLATGGAFFGIYFDGDYSDIGRISQTSPRMSSASHCRR
jgi:hypothetical protein